MTAARLAAVVLVAAAAVSGLAYPLASPGYAHHDTIAQAAWMHRWTVPEALPGDVSADYFRAFHFPPGVRAAYYVLVAVLKLPILTAAKVITVACFALTLALLYAVGRAAGGPGGGLATLAVGCAVDAFPDAALFSPLMTYHTGLARAFAVPVLLTTLLGLTTGRAWVTSLSVVAGALLYPPAFVVAVGAIGLNGLLRGSARKAGRYYLAHAVAGVLTAIVVLAWYPAPDSRFGKAFPFDVAVNMPECRAPGASTPDTGVLSGDGVFSAAVRPWLVHFWPVLVLLAALAALRHRLAVPLALVVAAAAVCAVAAVVLWFRLYEPSRFWLYPFRAVFAPAAGALLGAALVGRERLLAAVVMAAAACNVIAFADLRTKYPFPLPGPPPAVVKALTIADMESVVAWYSLDGNWVPLKARRPAFVSSIALFPYHDKFHADAVRRFVAVRDAVYATDWAAVRKLRDEHEVRFLLYSRDRFDPALFAAALTEDPGVAHLAHLTRDLLTAGPDRPFVLKTPPREAVAADERGTVLLDLTRLPRSDP